MLAPIADVEYSESTPRLEIEEDADDRRVLSWLLREHFEAHVESFEDDGLCLEGNKIHRAFFIGVEGAGRFIVWDSPQKKNNRREVVKQRGDKRPWFENEGFGYEVVLHDGTMVYSHQAVLHVHWSRCQNSIARIYEDGKGYASHEVGQE